MRIILSGVAESKSETLLKSYSNVGQAAANNKDCGLFLHKTFCAPNRVMFPYLPQDISVLFPILPVTKELGQFRLSVPSGDVDSPGAEPLGLDSLFGILPKGRFEINFCCNVCNGKVAYVNALEASKESSIASTSVVRIPMTDHRESFIAFF